MVPDGDKVTAINDVNCKEEGDDAQVPPLTTLTGEQKKNELWQEKWLRVFIDGCVSDPDGHRIPLRRCGILFGTGRSYNMAAAVTQKNSDSCGAKLQAAKLLFSGTRWGAGDTKLWITFDSQAAVKDLQRCIEGLPKDKQEFYRYAVNLAWYSNAEHKRAH